jgi:hypothetical protein
LEKYKNDILFETVGKLAVESDSLYKNDRLGKADLLEFMDANEWFGCTSPIQLCDIMKFEEILTLWLSAYKKPGRIKIDLMLRHFYMMYPNTCDLYRKFINDNHLEDKPSAWKTLDFLLSEIDREITDYSEIELEKLIIQIDSGMSLISARMFAEFLRTVTIDDRAVTNWLYTFESRESPERINDAYTLEEFSVMAYCVFNDEIRTRQRLLEKAAKSKQYADLWLFTALHFICALRTSDMKRLPAPALPYNREILLKNILNGVFTNSEACALVEEMIIRLKLKPLKPSKTSAHKNIPVLKLFVPESLKAPLGIIIAFSLIHHPEITVGNGFVVPSDNLSNIREFFGEYFVRALGNRRFSSRRCNKSYLQGIDSTASFYDAPGKPKGYMLAALARSHKGGIGSLAKTTDVYLKDARFSGYTPEFIIREMFERGVFSFIPTILLEIYGGKEYLALPINFQTKLIGEIGLLSHQIEWIFETAEQALAKSRLAVKSILQNPCRTNQNIDEILQNIASGNAPSRQEECLCLMTAAGFSCPCPDREFCIGCGYEIYTKTAMYSLMSEYARLVKLKKSTEQSEAWRYGKILEQAVLPAISEMLSTAKLLYEGSGVAELMDIVERGIEYADSLI